MSEWTCRMPYCDTAVGRPSDVCDECWEDRHRQLDELPGLWVLTHALLTPHRTVQEITGIRVSQPGPGVVFSMVAFDILEATYTTITDWAMVVMHSEETVRFASGPNGTDLAAAVKTLRARDGKLGSWPHAARYVTDLYRTYRRLVAFVREDSAELIRKPCPVCDFTSVVTRHADEFAVCMTCHTTWPASRIRSLRAA